MWWTERTGTGGGSASSNPKTIGIFLRRKASWPVAPIACRATNVRMRLGRGSRNNQIPRACVVVMNRLRWSGTAIPEFNIISRWPVKISQSDHTKLFIALLNWSRSWWFKNTGTSEAFEIKRTNFPIQESGTRNGIQKSWETKYERDLRPALEA